MSLATKKYTRAPGARLGVIVILLLLAAVAGLEIGPTGISIMECFTGELSQAELTVLRDIRLPRVLLGMIVGAALALAGAILQAFFRNPLADPGLIGISSGAALGAVIFLSVGSLSALLPGALGLCIFALGGGLAATLLIYLLARSNGQIRAVTFLLCGIAVNALLAACMSYLIFLSDDNELRSITFWMMGSLGFSTWREVWLVMPLLIVSLVAMPWLAKPLNLYILGESEAAQLGVDIKRLKRWIIVLCAAAVGAGVAVSGMIGFIGLVVPHIIRLFIGTDHRVLLPGSALFGAATILVSDLVARTILSPVELPLGIITAVIGAPFFLWLLNSERQRIFY